MNKKVSIVLISVLLLFSFLSLVKADTQTFTVPNLGSQVMSLNLTQGDSVSGSISVSGGSGNDVNIQITDPNGNSLGSYDRTTYESFSFTASISGTYELTFDNSFSLLSSKSVTVDYTVQTPTPAPLLGGGNGSGNMAEIGIIALIAVIILVMIVVAIGASRRNKTHTSQTSPLQSSVYTPKPPAPSSEASLTKTQTGFCPFCGTSVEQNTSFCRNCGKKI